MHWRDRFLYVMDGRSTRRSAATGEVKGHYLNVTAGDDGGRCTSAPSSRRSSARVIVMIDLVIGWTAIQSMSEWARRNDMVLHLHRAGPRHLHAPEEPRRQLPRDRQVACAWPACDHMHAGTAVGKLEGDPMTVQGYYNVCRDELHHRQDLAARPVLRPGLGRPEEGDAGGLGRHPRRPDAPAARICSATTWCCSSAAAPSATRHGHPGRRDRQPRRARGDGEGAQRGPRHRATRARRSCRPRRKCCTPLRAGARHLEAT